MGRAALRLSAGEGGRLFLSARIRRRRRNPLLRGGVRPALRLRLVRPLHARRQSVEDCRAHRPLDVHTMKKLVIDIETVGIPWEEHDPYVREYLIKGLSDGDAEEAKRSGGLSPFRGRIIAIGVINIDDGRSCAFYEVPGQQDVRVEKAGLRTYISRTEKQILEKFWDWFESDSRFIAFNGRQFDGPFLMIRSAIHGLAPKRDLVGNRYRFHPNCDLREGLNFNGTLNPRQTRFNLDLACKTFGIVSSKTEGMDGRAVETFYRAGRHEDIAVY